MDNIDKLKESRIATARRFYIITIIVALKAIREVLNRILGGIRTIYTDRFTSERKLRELIG